jgi:hypothetical protein
MIVADELSDCQAELVEALLSFSTKLYQGFAEKETISFDTYDQFDRFDQ